MSFHLFVCLKQLVALLLLINELQNINFAEFLILYSFLWLRVLQRW